MRKEIDSAAFTKPPWFQSLDAQECQSPHSSRCRESRAHCVSDLYSTQPTQLDPLKSHPLASAYRISQSISLQFLSEAPLRSAPSKFVPERSLPSRLTPLKSTCRQSRNRRSLLHRSQPSMRSIGSPRRLRMRCAYSPPTLSLLPFLDHHQIARADGEPGFQGRGPPGT